MMQRDFSQLSSPKRIAIFVTSVYMVRFFLVPHLKALSKKYDVTLIMNNDAPEILASIDVPVNIINLPIERKISLMKDFQVLLQSIILFRKEKFDVVHTMTPKAGLIGIVAAFIVCTPKRIHTFQGEVWANKKGFMRIFLRILDRLISWLSTHLIVVSHGEREFLIQEKIIDESKSFVIAEGSIGGVDLARFRPDVMVRDIKRKSLNYHEDDIVYLYIGRLNKDKGLITLRDAFIKLHEEQYHAHLKLLIVGPDEDDFEKLFIETISPSLLSNIHFHPYTDKPERFMNAADILVLPSLREGFGVVIIEAAAVGLPSICSNIYGLQDALVKDKTGLFFKVQDSKDLSYQMRRLAYDKDLCQSLSQNAQVYVRDKFDQKCVIKKFLDFYEQKVFRI